jgi:PleD family two-component response regulator
MVAVVVRRPQGELRVTFSAGVATTTTDHFDALLCAADAALYRAKDLGRDRVVAAGSSSAGSITA